MAIAGSGVNAMKMQVVDGKLRETKSSCASHLAVEDVDEAVRRLLDGEELYVLLYGSTVPNVRVAVNEKLGVIDLIRPAHYQNVPGIECKDVIGWFPGHIAQAMKYLWRCGYKPEADPIEDLKKCIKFCEFEIERLQKAKVSE